MNNTIKEFARRVHFFRTKRQYTQQLLAHLSETSQSEISRIENGRYQKINVETIIKLAEAFQVDRDELVRGTEFASIFEHHATLPNEPPNSEPPDRRPEVFISYRQIDDEQRQRVRILGEHLRESGINVILDQFFLDDNPGGPNEGWAKWSSDRALGADYVLIVGTDEWFRCFDKELLPGIGLGAAREADDLRQRIYTGSGVIHNLRMVLFDDTEGAHIPDILRPYHRFHAVRDFAQIVRWLGGTIMKADSLKQALDELRQLKSQLDEENSYLQHKLKPDPTFGEIVGESDAIKYVLFKVEQIAPTDTTVLITGETGTGKELIARAIHKASSRKNQPLIKVNCAALAPTLVESELFGHEKGAFRQAHSRKLGRFELANGGTIFLDEIAELPLMVQVKLLRVIQEGEFERLGGTRTIKTDVRIIATTDRNLKLEVENGSFREDLWYRLSVFPITVPPLRQRMEDVPLLVTHFVKRMSAKYGKVVDRIPSHVMATLKDYFWPDNVRELANAIERAVIHSPGPTLQLAGRLGSVSLNLQQPRTSIPHNLPLIQPFFGREQELRTIARALELESRTWGVLIDGPGGIGKTSLAVRAAYDAAPDTFEKIVFASLKSRELDDDGVQDLSGFLISGLAELLNEIARELGHAEIAKAQLEERPRLLLDVLRFTQALLVLDNLESLVKSERDIVFNFVNRLPPGCKAILTSRARIDSGAVELILEAFGENAALTMLAKLAETNPALAKTSEGERRLLYQETGGNPLLLRWAAGQIGRGSCLTVSDAITYLRSRPEGNDPLGFIYGEQVEDLIDHSRSSETNIVNDSVLLDEQFRQADLSEQEGRKLLEDHKYQEAIDKISSAMSLDRVRSTRLNEEFGFVLSLSDRWTTLSQSEQAKLGWQTNIWSVLSEHNTFEFKMLEENVAEAVATNETQTEDVAQNARVLSDATAEQRGEILEQAVLRLFKVFFCLGDDDGELELKLKKLRQQHRGTQFGFDIAVEFDCVLEWNQTIRCHVECKNLGDKIALKDIADKLISQSQFDPDIDLWILISPHADPTNELEQILQSFKQRSPYPFDIRIWSPATGVAEFFGLEPSVYDSLFECEAEELHPREWDDVKRASVRDRWKQDLTPPLRLPKGWDRYLRNPYLMCLRREAAKDLDKTYATHVAMHCKNDAGILMPQPCEYYIREWLTQPNKAVLFLLGEFGDGKTFFTYSLARRLADEFLSNPKSGWIPLRLCLRDYYEAENSRDFLRRRLEELGADLEGWATLLATQRLLVILDGFDEISRELDPSTITRNITALIRCCEEFEGCKVMITSRTHFFERRQDVKRLMSRLSNPIIYYLASIPRRTTVQHLEDFASLLNVDHAMTKLHSLHDPIGLATKPLFLQMVKETFQDLPDDFNEVTLYEKYILNSLKRKAEHLDDENLTVDRDELLNSLMSLLGEIAVELQSSGNDYVSLNHFARQKQRNFAELLWRMTGSEEDQQDAQARVGVRSVLSRVETNNMESEWTVDFCHRSIREYFVAKSLSLSLLKGMIEGEQFFRDVPLNHEILDFAAIHMRNTVSRPWVDALLELVRQATPNRNPGRLGGNAMTILYRVSHSLPETDWTGKVFDYADLEGADLSNRNFQGSSFRGANLRNVNFENSNFKNCDFTGVRIEETVAVSSVAALPGGDRVLAIYGDGTGREWKICHPRKTESNLIPAKFSRGQASLGILNNGYSWVREARAISFIDADRDMRLVARFLTKDSYRCESLDNSDLLLLRDLQDDNVRVLLIDLERWGVVKTLETSGVAVCTPLGRDALVLGDRRSGLRLVRWENPHDSTELGSGTTTCLSSICIGGHKHVVVCGQDDGMLHGWAIELRPDEVLITKILSSRIHEGMVTTVAFVDSSKILSGGRDRTIVITAIDIKGQTLSGRFERELQLTMRCKGMQIDGLVGLEEQRQLSALIQSAETR